MNAASVSAARPEMQILTCCACRELAPDRRDQLSIILRDEKVDWAYTLRRAHWHGVLPLLAKHLPAAFAEHVPTLVRDDLQRLFQFNARRNLNLAAELLKLLRAFSARGIAAVPFKGPVIALTLYGDLSLRQFVDLDLLVRRSDILAARKILFDVGLVPQFELTEREELAYFEFRSEHAFSCPGKDLMVDLHCALTPRHFSAPLDLERYASRLRPMLLGNVQVPAFSREDLLLLMCVHGAKDTWERLILVADIAEIIGGGPLDWTYIREEAADIGAERMLSTGLLLARDLLDADLPPDAQRTAEADIAARSLADRATALLLRDAEGPPTFIERQAFAFHSIKEPMHAFQYVVENILTPTPLEWRLVRLPERFSFLYHLLRPLRLTGKHLRGLVQAEPAKLSRYKPTPDEIVRRMLEMAEVAAGDVVFDLGSGDGRVLIAAAQRGASGYGFEINDELVAQARANAKRAGVEHTVKFRNASALDADLSRASVVTLYLPWPAAFKLRPKLLAELRPGARIVSHGVGLADWIPDCVQDVESPEGTKTTLYLWRIGT